MKITSVRVRPVSCQVRAQFAIVSAAGSHPVSHFVLVDIEIEGGITGTGEASVTPVWSGESQQSVLHAVENILAPIVTGRDVFEVSAVADAMDRVLIGNFFTKAAVEMAMLDAAGKALGAPVHSLLGGRRRGAIPLKFSIGAFAPSKAAEVARSAVERGLRACKVKVGLDVAADLARVAAVRSEVGERFPIGVDANAGWTEAEAVSALPHLERLGVNALEQPIRRGDFRGCARIRQRTGIPLMLDESVFSPQDALEAIRLDAADILSVYPGKNGGILRSMQIAAMAEAAGIECVIGSNLEMNSGTAGMLALAAAMPALSTSVNHDIIGPLYYDQPTPIVYRDGCALPPEGPGLGV